MARSQHPLRKAITDFVSFHPNSSSKEIHSGITLTVGYATVKRSLQDLVVEKLIIKQGQGKSTHYAISPIFALLKPMDIELYFQKEVDEREIQTGFNHDLIAVTISSNDLFTESELEYLTRLQKQFKQNTASLNQEQYNKEFERLAIDLSWKSSQIEGNTYSLLDTELLLKEQITQAGKTKDEATMLLNHKAALDFIIAHPDYVHPLTTRSIEDYHALLIQNLPVTRNIRQHRVGITGTNYRPPDNEYHIREALTSTCELINQRENIFEKALLALTLLSYIQPFEDGNKRTARITANAILIHYGYCPVSFRTIDPVDYKKAVILFYEQNNISTLKKIFIEQFEFAVKTYF